MGEITKSKSEASLGFGGLPPTIKQLAVRILLAAGCGPKTTNNTTSTEDAPPFHSNPAGFHSNPREQFFIQILQSRCPSPKSLSHDNTMCVHTCELRSRPTSKKLRAHWFRRFGLVMWGAGALYNPSYHPRHLPLMCACSDPERPGRLHARFGSGGCGGLIPVILHATATPAVALASAENRD